MSISIQLGVMHRVMTLLTYLTDGVLVKIFIDKSFHQLKRKGERKLWFIAKHIALLLLYSVMGLQNLPLE